MESKVSSVYNKNSYSIYQLKYGHGQQAGRRNTDEACMMILDKFSRFRYSSYNYGDVCLQYQKVQRFSVSDFMKLSAVVPGKGPCLSQAIYLEI